MPGDSSDGLVSRRLRSSCRRRPGRIPDSKHRHRVRRGSCVNGLPRAGRRLRPYTSWWTTMNAMDTVGMHRQRWYHQGILRCGHCTVEYGGKLVSSGGSRRREDKRELIVAPPLGRCFFAAQDNARFKFVCTLFPGAWWLCMQWDFLLPWGWVLSEAVFGRVMVALPEYPVATITNSILCLPGCYFPFQYPLNPRSWTVPRHIASTQSITANLSWSFKSESGGRCPRSVVPAL